jgi:phosphoribosylglycinamide formyltransferase-1
MTVKKRVGILISGRGSNMTALVEACRSPDYPAEIVLVISNRPGALGLERADQAGISTRTINHEEFSSREAFDAALDQALRDAAVEIVCNAGFMRLHTAGLVEVWRDRHLNIHPSLLPAFRGLHSHERALEAGVAVSGATVHFMRAEMDAGPIISQVALPVLSSDTPDILAARVLLAEHQLYPHALRLVASGDVWVENEKVMACPGIARHLPFQGTDMQSL